MSRRRLLVVDAPGGPHPELYLRSLLAEFEVHAVWLAVESGAALSRRARALAPIESAGGQLIVVRDPAQVASTVVAALARVQAHGVVAFSERVVRTAQEAATAVGLPGNAPQVLRALQDKRRQRACLRAAGVPTPAVVELPTLDDVERAARTFDFPGVLKPSTGMGSVATFRVACPEGLLPAWHRASELVRSDVRIAHTSPVMIFEQELIGAPTLADPRLGDYLSVEGIVVGGELHVLAVSDKLPLSYPYRENGHILPAVRPPEEFRDAVEHVRAAHQALGIQFGASHTEVKLTPDGPRIIEINGRVGGSVPEQLLLAADYDLPLNLARAAVGQRPEVDVSCHSWTAYLTPQPPDGRHLVERAVGLGALADVPGVRSVHYLTATGSVVDSADGTASNLTRVVAATRTSAEILNLADLLLGPELFELRSIRRQNESDVHA